MIVLIKYIIRKKIGPASACTSFVSIQVDSSSLDLETILFLLYVFTVPVKIPMTTLTGNGLNLVDSSPVPLVCQGISPICLDNHP